MRTTFTFHSAQQLIFGAQAVNQIGEIARRHKLRAIYVITDPVLMGLGLLNHVQQPLWDAGIHLEVFGAGEPEPSLGVVQTAIFMAQRFQPDAILGLGGGSNMDMAKLVAVCLQHGGDPRDYVGENKVPGPVAPLICVPTTAGTGSEVSQAAVFTDTDKQLKVSVLSNYLRPTVALVDPLLTHSCPPKVTADSGIDALTHAIEGFTAVDNADYPVPAEERSVYQGKNPLADMTAEKAIQLVFQHLRRAVQNGNDVQAREGMALAATLGGLAFSNAGVALVHAMEYPVGAATHCSHGAGNGLLLPYVMRYNLPKRTAEMAQMAQWMGVATNGWSEEAAAHKAIEAVEQLRKEIGIPERLRDLGVQENQLEQFAEKAFSIKRLMRVNPRFPNEEEIETIYRQAF